MKRVTGLLLGLILVMLGVYTLRPRPPGRKSEAGSYSSQALAESRSIQQLSSAIQYTPGLADYTVSCSSYTSYTQGNSHIRAITPHTLVYYPGAKVIRLHHNFEPTGEPNWSLAGVFVEDIHAIARANGVLSDLKRHVEERQQRLLR